MAYPSLQSIRIIDPILTNIAHGFRQPEFVGNLAFPPAPVMKRQGKIIRFNEDEFILHEMRRSPGANIQRVMGGWGNDDYELYQDAIEEKLPIEHLEEASDINIDMQRRSMNKAMRRIMLRLEVDQMTLLGDINQYPATNRLALSGTDRWSDPGSNIEAQIQTAHQAVLDGCGLLANTMILSLSAFFAMARHPLVRDKIKYTSMESVTPTMLAAMWNLRTVAIAAAKYILPNTTAKVNVFDNRAWIGYVPEQGVPVLGAVMPTSESSIDTPSFGYTYTLQDYPIAEQPYYEQNTRTWFFPVIAERRPVLTGLGAGYLWTSVTA
jgi:hypothetical protein